jgi:hypothetical protein
MRKSEPTSINAPYLDPPERLLLKSKQAHEGGLAGPLMARDGRMTVAIVAMGSTLLQASRKNQISSRRPAAS